MSESASESSYQTVEIDGIGPIRGREGTSTLELAGAAKYWQDKAKRAERVNKGQWANGFSAGVAACGTLALLVSAVCHFFIH